MKKRILQLGYTFAFLPFALSILCSVSYPSIRVIALLLSFFCVPTSLAFGIYVLVKKQIGHGIAILILSVFLCTLGAFICVGVSAHAAEKQHIENMQLRQQQDSINFYPF
jgi:FtsH-binding integral membrane protein